VKLHVRYRDIESTPELQHLIERRIDFGLSQFVDAIHEVHVTVADVNGPRGGVDKVCRVRLTGPGLAPIVVEQAAAEVTAAIDGAIARSARSISRHLARRRLVAATTA